jgi:hypothetical protein
MKRLMMAVLLFTLTLLLVMPALAQTEAPEPTATDTPDATAEAPSTPEAEATLEPVEGSVPVDMVIDLLERQPELITDVTEIVTDQIGSVFQQSMLFGSVALVVFGVIVVGGGFFLYRSVPLDRRESVGRQIGGAGSAILGRLDELDLLPTTDIENIILRALKNALDSKLAPIVDAKVQALYEDEKERKRENERAQRANAQQAGEGKAEEPGIFVPNKPAHG